MSQRRLPRPFVWALIVGCSRSGPVESSEPPPASQATRATPAAPAPEAAAAPPAQGKPAEALYRVVGVASDDMLALRAEPSASAEQLGEIPAGSMGLVSWGEDRRVQESTWRPIEHGGRRGWVNARYLTPDTPPGAPLPRALRCVGTEPFWALTLEPGAAARFEEPGGEPLSGLTTSPAVAAGAERWTMGVESSASGQGSKRRAMTASVARSRKCSDGMSDGIYEYEVSVAVEGGRKLLGCCRDSRDMIR